MSVLSARGHGDRERAAGGVVSGTQGVRGCVQVITEDHRHLSSLALLSWLAPRVAVRPPEWADTLAGVCTAKGRVSAGAD